jgi:Zn-dependent protease with chaperone function
MTTQYLLRGAIIALAWLAVVNLGATAAVALAARRRAAAPPSIWLALRLLPSAASLLFVAVLSVPSYWRYEPQNPAEGVDVTLAALAIASVAILAAGAARGLASWCRASRRTRAWIRSGRPIALAGTSIAAYEVPIEMPMMALAGVFRPRLLVTRGVLEALTADELRASVAHEVGHWRAGDNLKRLAMRAAPDLLFATRAASSLESRWAAAAEHAADRRACADADSRYALAAALVKVAKLTPPPTPLAEPISTLFDGGDLVSRVRRLLDDPEPFAPRRGGWSAALAALAAAVALAVLYTPLLRAVHEATEILVNTLP